MRTAILRTIVAIEVVIVGGLLLVLTPNKVLARQYGCCHTGCKSNDWKDGCGPEPQHYCTQTKLEKTSCITYECNGAVPCGET